MIYNITKGKVHKYHIRFLSLNEWQPLPQLDSHTLLSGTLHQQSLMQIFPAIHQLQYISQYRKR